MKIDGKEFALFEITSDIRNCSHKEIQVGTFSGFF
jgi:hypothetical protein